MVIHLAAGEEWIYSPPGARTEVGFASVSTRYGKVARFEVIFNGDEFDCVNVAVPHSWWPPTGQVFCPQMNSGDELLLRADEAVDVRLDLHEHEV